MTAPSYRSLVRQLSTVQKSGRGAPAYSRWVNRRLGRYLAAWAYRRDLTPNQVTAISATFTAAAIVALAALRPSAGLGCAVSAGLLIGYAFDAADGQLARLTQRGSPAGEWLDHVVDCAKAAALHGAVAISWYRFFELRSSAYLLIPLAYGVVSVTFFFATVLSEQLRRAASASGHVREPSPLGGSRLRSYVVLAWDFGLLGLVFVTLGAHTVFGVAYTVLATANLALFAVAARRWYRELGGYT